MKICVFGAGAIGGLLAVELSRAGEEVSVVARGAHLEAIRARGLALVGAGQERRVAHLCAADDAAGLGPQEVVIVAVKANAIPEAAEHLAPLLGPTTAVVTAANGVPWWYFHRSGDPFEGQSLDSVNPGGRAWRAIGPERAIGCVVYAACDVVEPGVIAQEAQGRFALGEPDGTRSERCAALVAAFKRAGLSAAMREHIRHDVWVKLWGNACFNPISLLTGATLDVIATEPATRELCRRTMAEIQEVGEALGVRFGITIDQRIAGTAQVVGHKTSMRQDLERGRMPELDAVIGAVQEIARRLDRPTPLLDALAALARQACLVAGVV